MKHCAILSMDSLVDFEAYDHLIEPHLQRLGWLTETVSWRRKNVDWGRFDVVLIRTPWDYQDDAGAFINVLSDIEKSTARLENALDIVKWNIDKIYLQELESQGVSLVPTIWCNKLSGAQLSSETLDNWFDEFGVDQIILKPRISANADNTFWIKQSSSYDINALEYAFSNRNFMVQPFVSAVIEEGEYSLFYFDGQYSHAILKTPKRGDFRVQEEHGGRLKRIDPEPQLLQAAEKCMAGINTLHQRPLYARLDLVQFGGEFVLMEAELIEPSLYFNMDPNSAETFANAFVAKMARCGL